MCNNTNSSGSFTTALAIMIAFGIGVVLSLLIFGDVGQSQIIVQTTSVPDETAQANVNESISALQLYTSSEVKTQIAEDISEGFYNVQGTMNAELPTIVANTEYGIYNRIRIQLSAEGMTFNATPIPATPYPKGGK